MDNEIKDILENIGGDIVDMMQQKLIRNKRRATGTLINDISYEIMGNKLIVHYSDYGPVTVNPRTRATSGVIDQGRRKGQTPPPINPILQWLKVKRIKWTTGGSSKDVLSKNKKKQMTAEKKNKQMAFVIARSIGKKGFKGVDFTEPLKVIIKETGSGNKFLGYLKNIFKK